MDFTLTDDHRALREAVRRYCDDTYPAQDRGSWEDAERAQRRHQGMAELGLLGLTVDATHGGSGLGAIESMLAAQELGRVLAGPGWLAGTVLGGSLIADAGSAEQRARWLPAMARGELRVAAAVHEDAGRYALNHVQTRAVRTADGWRLHGGKALVVGGDAAQLLLVSARTGGEPEDDQGITLFALEAGRAGLAIQPLRLLDGRGAANVELNAVAARDGDMLGTVGGALEPITRAVARGEAVLCAESVGALEALLALTCQHLKARQQFGSPLAKFQVLQHAVAEMAMALEQIKSMACVAALASDDDTRPRDRAIASAKALTAQLARRCAFSAIQLHGAMGMTDECRVSHYAKRLIANGLLFGDASFHLQRVAALATSHFQGDAT